MKENIQLHMLTILSDASTPINSKTMAAKLGISEKTTLKYLNFLKQDIEDYGATIDIKQGQGSVLTVNDPTIFTQYLHQLSQDDYLNDPTKRNVYILSRFLLESDYINVYDMADELAISPSLLRSCLKTISQTLSKYNIDLIHSHLYGYKIKGDENDVRRCLMKECRTSIDINSLLSTQHLNIDVNAIQQIVFSTLKDYDIAITKDGMRSLTLHILLCIYRYETNNLVKDSETIEPYLRSSNEYFVINSINRKINAAYGIDLPVAELMYLTLHLSGKQRDARHQHIQVKVNNDALVFYNKFLRNIYKYSNIDFFDDSELRTSLLNHIVPFITRYQNDNQIEKSELLDVRNQFPLAYDLACSGLYHLTTDIDKKPISVAEISYFSLHLALALEKRKRGADPINIAVIVEEDKINSLYSLLTFKLNENFGSALNTISFFPAEIVTQEQVENCRLILNTTSLILPFSRVLKVSPYLSMDDIHQIQDAIEIFQTNDQFDSVIIPQLFTDINGDDPETLLTNLTNQLQHFVELPANFVDLLMQRERFFSTSYDTGIAVPHPLENSRQQNFIAIARPSHPIKWGDHTVRLIFVTCLYGNHEFSMNFFRKIGILSQSKKAVDLLLDNFDEYPHFISMMHSLETMERNNQL